MSAKYFDVIKHQPNFNYIAKVEILMYVTTWYW